MHAGFWTRDGISPQFQVSDAPALMMNLGLKASSESREDLGLFGIAGFLLSVSGCKRIIKFRFYMHSLHNSNWGLIRCYTGVGPFNSQLNDVWYFPCSYLTRRSQSLAENRVVLSWNGLVPSPMFKVLTTLRVESSTLNHPIVESEESSLHLLFVPLPQGRL
jgi:hypothetical protein